MSHKSHRSYVCVSRLRSALCAGLVYLVLILPTVVLSDIIIAEHDWDTEPASGVGNWASQDGNAAVTENVGGGVGGTDSLQISFPGGIDPGPGAQWYDTVSTPSDDLFAGTWITDYWVEFDFWAEDVVPATLQIRWGVDGGNTWGNTIDTSGVGIGSWGSLRTDSFSDFTDWKIDPFATSEQFLTDLGSIDWIGVYIFRDGTAAELYGVDNFKLMVPEPAEYLLLFAALGTALVAMRRKNNYLAVVEA